MCLAKKTYYTPGDYNIIDDMTGFKIKASQARMTWDNWFVGKLSWEPRNEQEFLRGIPDMQDVSIPRPEATDIFTDAGLPLGIYFLLRQGGIPLSQQGGGNFFLQSNSIPDTN